MIPVDAVTPCQTGDHDPDLWFSEDDQDVLLARALCAGCPFREACKVLGAGAEFGVWGGDQHVVTREERRSQRIAEVVWLHDEGLRPFEIGRKLDLAHSSVAYALKRGLALREETKA